MGSSKAADIETRGVAEAFLPTMMALRSDLPPTITQRVFRFWLALACASLCACAPFSVKGPHVDQPALAPARVGQIAERVADIDLDEGESAYRLMTSNADGLALRLHSAEQAISSLDLQYYMWVNDTSGRLLASELLRAADRGVRVRVLIDDAYARKLDRVLMTLDAHPNLELRLYNPYRTRASIVGNVFEFVFSGLRPNHRMHNKAWIVDGQIAIVGGQNIGDEYFGVHEGFNFRDLGVLVSGAAAREASAEFDTYWNSPIVIPLAAIPPPPGPALDLAQAQRALEQERAQTLAAPLFAEALKAGELAADMRSGAGRQRGLQAHIIADPPDKWQQRDDHLLGVAADLHRIIDSAQHEVILVSPYFVPGADGVRWLARLHARGVRVRVLTNSLNATDVAAVHGGYARYRRRLLRAGIEINELKRASSIRVESSFRGSSKASLHTKAVVVDGHHAFVGSFNLTPRSTWINTEMGVLIDDPRFAELVRANYEQSLTPEHSYRLSLEGRRLVWTDVQDGHPRRQFSEPTSSWSRRIIAFLARVLPVERHL